MKGLEVVKAIRTLREISTDPDARGQAPAAFWPAFEAGR
jgi:hypothetical protein